MDQEKKLKAGRNPGQRLTPREVQALRVPGLYADNKNGLYLQVTPATLKGKPVFDGDGKPVVAKSWIYRFWDGERSRKFGLGTPDFVTLAKARQHAADARDQWRNGAKVNPIDERQQKRAKTKIAVAKTMTFKQCADAYIAAHSAGWRSDRHATQWHATFHETIRKGHRFPSATAAIDALPVSSIDTALVLAVLEPLWSKTPVTARRVRGRIERVLDWAKAREFRTGENPSRWRGHLDTLLQKKAPEVEHLAAMPYDAVPGFMATLRARNEIVARALEVTILCATRTSETLGARWGEIDGKTWVIPGARMKAGQAHTIPLSDRAMQILRRPVGGKDSDLVFPGKQPGALIDKPAMLEMLRGLSGKKLTVHGMRSAFRDWAGDRSGFNRETIEFALAHGITDKTEEAYRRGTAIAKRAKLMSAWSSYCQSPPAKVDNVRNIREAPR